MTWGVTPQACERFWSEYPIDLLGVHRRTTVGLMPAVPTAGAAPTVVIIRVASRVTAEGKVGRGESDSILKSGCFHQDVDGGLVEVPSGVILSEVKQ